MGGESWVAVQLLYTNMSILPLMDDEALVAVQLLYVICCIVYSHLEEEYPSLAFFSLRINAHIVHIHTHYPVQTLATHKSVSLESATVSNT